MRTRHGLYVYSVRLVSEASSGGLMFTRERRGASSSSSPVTQSKTRNAAVDNRCPRFAFHVIILSPTAAAATAVAAVVTCNYRARCAAGLKNVERRGGEWVFG